MCNPVTFPFCPDSIALHFECFELSPYTAFTADVHGSCLPFQARAQILQDQGALDDSCPSAFSCKMKCQENKLSLKYGRQKGIQFDSVLKSLQVNKHYVPQSLHLGLSYTIAHKYSKGSHFISFYAGKLNQAPLVSKACIT